MLTRLRLGIISTDRQILVETGCVDQTQTLKMMSARQTGISRVEADMQTGISRVEADMQTGISRVEADMQTGISRVEADMLQQLLELSFEHDK